MNNTELVKSNLSLRGQVAALCLLLAFGAFLHGDGVIFGPVLGVLWLICAALNAFIYFYDKSNSSQD